jgi:ATP-dependent DNA helicase HFM1/MER3
MKRYTTALENAIILSTCLKNRCWPDTSNVIKQTEKIGKVMTTQLNQAGIVTIEQLKCADPRRIELVSNER